VQSIFVCPGFVTEIEPAHAQAVLLFANTTGLFASLVFFAAGAQGATGIGMQDDGIKTGTGPAIFQFIGLAGDKQFPKAGMFTNGMISKQFAIGLVFAVRVLFKGRTSIDLGPDPKEHAILAPLHTHFAMS
jgi:hypothetical protein|tara:strand:+ start:34247 stop:34639 length:393 start_codon:yes stop_codon:yes gene_type:complete